MEDLLRTVPARVEVRKHILMGATGQAKPRDGCLPMAQAEMGGDGDGCLPMLQVAAPEQPGLDIPCRGGDKSGIPHHSVTALITGINSIPAMIDVDGSDRRGMCDGLVGLCRRMCQSGRMCEPSCTRDFGR